MAVESGGMSDGLSFLSDIGPQEVLDDPDLTDAGGLAGLVNDSLDAGSWFASLKSFNPAESLGWWLLFCPALWSLADRERRRPWMLAAALAFFVLAAGPYLRWFDRFRFGFHQVAVPLPAWLAYKFLPGFNLFYRPIRFSFVAGALLLGPAAAGIGLAASPSGKIRSFMTAAIACLAFAVGLAEYQGGHSFRSVDVPTIPQRELTELRPRALATVPFFPLPIGNANAESMLAQAAHGIPIFNATLLRIGELRRFADFVNGNEVLRALLDLQLRRDPVSEVKDPGVLAAQGLDLICVRSEFVEQDPETDRWRRWPHEMFFHLKRWYGTPRSIPGGFLFDARSEAPPTGRDVEQCSRLRFERQDFRSREERRFVGHVAVDIPPNGAAPWLAFSLPGIAETPQMFCAWLRLTPSNQIPISARLEMRDGATRTASLLLSPIGSEPRWRWRCCNLSEFTPPNGGVPPDVRDMVELRFAVEGGDGVLAEMDDAAIISSSPSLEAE